MVQPPFEIFQFLLGPEQLFQPRTYLLFKGSIEMISDTDIENIRGSGGSSPRPLGTVGRAGTSNTKVVGLNPAKTTKFL